jgi:hypothetical protein
MLAVTPLGSVAVGPSRGTVFDAQCLADDGRLGAGSGQAIDPLLLPAPGHRPDREEHSRWWVSLSPGRVLALTLPRSLLTEHGVDGKKKIGVTLVFRGDSALSDSQMALREASSLCTLARIEPRLFKVQTGDAPVAEDGRSVRLLVTEVCPPPPLPSPLSEAMSVL